MDILCFKYPLLHDGIPSNTFQVISGQCLLVTEGMITILKCCPTEISHCRHSHMISAQRQSTSSCVELPFICQALDN